ncbi:MAG: response regulator transcription factor [Acidobacteria bacterium]|nr:response regulator transcription factor [Acidobacteriota bacterium]MBI3427678.1 response regulator transcription factor [Acidobacteriota bacterium]
MENLRVFLVDDHAVLREGLMGLINRQTDMQVVGQAGDGQSVLRQAPNVNPAVVVMDISMPKMNGIEATERLKEVSPQTKVVILTRHSDVGYLRMIMQAGAAGYVSKQSDSTDLLTAIRTVAAGGTFIDRELTGQLLNNYLGRQLPQPGGSMVDMTEREESVLRLIAWGHSNKEIADQLGISVKTVEYHKARAMEKLTLRSRAEVVNYALHRGWLQEN